MGSIHVKVVAFPRSVGILRAHGDSIDRLLFIVLQLGDDSVRVVMGFASQDRSLALLHAWGYDMGRLARFYARPCEGEPEYPPETFKIGLVGAGWVDVCVRKRQHVPGEDVIRQWGSTTLRVDTPPKLRIDLREVILAQVGLAIALDNWANPPLPQSEDGW